MRLSAGGGGEGHRRAPASIGASSAVVITNMDDDYDDDHGDDDGKERTLLRRKQPAAAGGASRRRVRSSGTQSKNLACNLRHGGSERAVRTAILAMLVASLGTVLLLAVKVPSPDRMEEEGRIMWSHMEVGSGSRKGSSYTHSWWSSRNGEHENSVGVVLPSLTVANAEQRIAMLRSFERSYEHQLRLQEQVHRKPGSVLLPQQRLSSLPRSSNASWSDDQWEANYGGLEINLFEEEGGTRVIYRDFDLEKTKGERSPVKEESVDGYYAFDDDAKRNPYHKRASKKGQRCRRTKFHRRLPVNCNTMYEMDFHRVVETGNQKHLGGGSYRDVHLITLEGDGKYVYKTSGPGAHYRYDDYEFIRMDCVVLELFSSSPLIVNSYAYCGLDQIGEAMLNGDYEKLSWPRGERRKNFTLNDKDHLDPWNSLTPDDKLRFALEMAEPLALLHGFHGGVIVHDDVQLSQYLLTEDGKHIRLNDFNRAEFMLWNEDKQEYCKYRNNPGHGDWRSPEEYFDNPLDEKIDIFSFGNNLYSTLTGLSPFYDTCYHTKEVQERVKKGDKPYIDPRWRTNSFAEGKIVELIERCFEYDPEDRIDIFEAVRFLRDAVEENERRKKGQ